MIKQFSYSFFALLALLFVSTTGVTADENLYCGDGIISAGEQCDDGNFENRDGCSSYCALEDIVPAAIISTSIENEAENVSNLTEEIIITFDDEVTLEGLLDKVVFKEYSKEKPVSLSLSSNQKVLTVHFVEPLKGEQDYGIAIQNYEDAVGNINETLFVTVFSTGEFVDVIPPNVIAKPAGGHYTIAQSVSLKAYDGELTFADAYLDEGAVIHYTLDGKTPTTDSEIFENNIALKTDTTVKFFSLDESGNKSDIKTEKYTFDCSDKPNAKSVSAYPLCKVEECNNGFILKSNACVIRLGEGDPNDFTDGAVSAPLFGSDAVMTISTKPSLYITPEHEGVIPRPILFKDLAGGTTIEFDRDTEINELNGKPFTGYIKPPDNLWTKSFPINFGYSFKSIFHFTPVGEIDLSFSPMAKITVPFTDRYDKGEPITVFTFDPNTEEYYVYNPNLITVDEENETVSIASNSTGIFFIAQPGSNFNAIEFKDTEDHWAKNYIELLYRKGHVKGRSKGVFAPDDILTRAEFTKIALNAIGEEVDPLESVEDSPFNDVALYAWYAPYIKRAKELELIGGYADGTFKPDEPINRVEAIKLLMAAFDFDLESTLNSANDFNDIERNTWYYASTTFAIKTGLIDGIRLPNGVIQNNAFGPGRNLSRGEMAKMAIKAIDLKEAQAVEVE